MDWIDPRHAAKSETAVAKRRKKAAARTVAKTPKKRGKPLATQVSAALAQPLEVWSVAFDHATRKLKWPSGCSVESTFLWSAVMQEQAEVLVRAGMSARKLSAIVSEANPTNVDEKASQLSEVVGLMDQSLESMAFQWLDSIDGYPDAALAVSALAWHLPEHAQRPGNSWLAQWLQAATDRAAAYKPDHEEPAVCNLVLQCELSLLIGLATTASKRTMATEATQAMDNLAEHLERAADNSAPWLVHGGTYLRAALACVLRCRVLANALGLRKWYPPQQKALAELLKHAARLCRPDGTQLLAAPHRSPRSKAIWDALAGHTKQSKSLMAALAFSGVGSGKRNEFRTKTIVNKLPALTHYSSASMGACMQSDWRHKGSRIAIDFSDPTICLEALGPKGQPLLVGEWTAAVKLDGQSQLQLDEWGEVCWFSDDDVDYLEVQAQFGQHAKIQRQAVLFREERLLLLADALLCDEPGAWSLESQIPLAGGAQFETQKKTTEGYIQTASGSRCLAMPLFLPEWKRQLSLSGAALNMKSDEDNLIVQAGTSSARLYAPVLISLCTSHAQLPFTWRHLTVGDDLRIVGGDEAVAYRIQIGSEQWIVYRSLDAARRRTALGMHTMSDFFAGRFDADDGEVDPIVEVEASA